MRPGAASHGLASAPARVAVQQRQHSRSRWATYPWRSDVSSRVRLPLPLGAGGRGRRGCSSGEADGPLVVGQEPLPCLPAFLCCCQRLPDAQLPAAGLFCVTDASGGELALVVLVPVARAASSRHATEVPAWHLPAPSPALPHASSTIHTRVFFISPGSLVHLQPPFVTNQASPGRGGGHPRRATCSRHRRPAPIM